MAREQLCILTVVVVICVIKMLRATHIHSQNYTTGELGIGLWTAPMSISRS